MYEALAAAEAALARAESLLDRASEHEPWDEHVQALWRLRRRLDGLLGATGARFAASGVWAAAGMRSTRAWWRGHVTDGAAGAAVMERGVDAVRTAPLFAAAMSRGEVGPAHARVIVEAHREFPRLAEALTQVEPVLLDFAREHTPHQLRRRLFRTLHRIDPVAVDDADARRRERQAYLHVSTLLDGWVRVDGSLPPEVGQTLAGCLASARCATDVAPDVSGAPGPRPRTSHLNIAALARILAAATALEGDQRLPDVDGARPVVHVTISLADFMAAREAAGTTPGDLVPFAAAHCGEQHLSAEAIRRIACDSQIRRLVIDPAGRVLEYGEPTRTVTRGMRLRIWQRDRHCRFPRCDAPIHHVHHIRHAAHGGPTRPDNLVGLCFHHHHLVHEGGWEVTGDPETGATFHPPSRRRLAA